MTALYAAVRGLHLAGLMVCFGSAVLLLRLNRAVPELGLESTALHRFRLAAAGVALLTGPLWLALATAQMAGSNAAMGDPALLQTALTGTLFGQMLALRMVLSLFLLVAVALRRQGATILVCGAALVSVSATSHAAAGGLSMLGLAADALHLLCGAIWLGGLTVLAAILMERPQAPRLSQAVSRFADTAMIAVALLVMTGLLNAAFILLDGQAARLYLGVLGAKLALVLAMTVLALINHFRLLPRLAQTQARATLKGNVLWEAALGMLVVLLAGLLGLLPPTL